MVRHKAFEDGSAVIARSRKPCSAPLHDTRQHQPTPLGADYGSEGWGFESLRARKNALVIGFVT